MALFYRVNIIPAEIDGKPVNELGMNCFARNLEIEEVIISEEFRKFR